MAKCICTNTSHHHGETCQRDRAERNGLCKDCDDKNKWPQLLSPEEQEHLSRVEEEIRARARRYEFSAPVELTEIRSERQIAGRTINISLYGCALKTTSAFRKGTKVTVKISHASAYFGAIGKVIRSTVNSEMGLVFLAIDSANQRLLEDWIAKARQDSTNAEMSQRF